MQLEEYNDQYTEMVKTFWPKFAESLKPEHGTQTPGEVRCSLLGLVQAVMLSEAEVPGRRHFMTGRRTRGVS